MSNDIGPDTKSLATLPMAVQAGAAMVDSQQAAVMLPAFKALWPKEYESSPAMMLALAKVAIAYGLDPLAGELMILGGKLYVTFEGRLRKALEKPQYVGLECRPATDEERAAFRCAETDHLWRAEIYRSDWKKPVVGWGRVTQNDGNPVARQHPQNVAEKRAKARALRDAFSIPLPSAEDAEDFPGAPAYIDQSTGEVLDTRPGGMLANRGQIAAIHALCKQLELEEDARHDAMQAMFGKGATNELTEGEAAAFLEHLGNLEAEREASDPAVIEAKRLDEILYTPPRAHPRPIAPVAGWPPPAAEADYGQDEAEIEAEAEAVEDEEMSGRDAILLAWGEAVKLSDATPIPAPDLKARAAAVREALLSLDAMGEAGRLAALVTMLTCGRTQYLTQLRPQELDALEALAKAGRLAELASVVMVEED